MTVLEDVMPKLTIHTEKPRRRGVMMVDSAAVSALLRHDPSEEKQSGFEIIITKTRGGCVITRFWPNQEMGRK